MSAISAPRSRDSIRGLPVAIAVLVGLGAFVRLRFAEPWYGNLLVERMQSGEHQAPWREETSKISDLFPDEMSREAGVALLKQNGFSCIRSGGAPEAEQLQCTRKKSRVVCTVGYAVSFAVDRERVRGLHAQSHQACL